LSPALCRKLSLLADTEVRCNENGPGVAGRGAGRFLVLEPRNCRSCRYYRNCRWLAPHTRYHAVWTAGA